MLQYIIRRLLISIPVLFAVTVVFYLLADLMPGDAVAAMMTSEAPISRAALASMRSRMGLDQPWPLRYVRWLQGLLRGNLGYSYITFESVTKAIRTRLPATLELMGVSMLISIIIGMMLGIVSALKQYSALDFTLTVCGFIGLSVPVFFLGLILIYVFALRLKVLPVSGMSIPGIPFSLADNLRHLALPMLSLSVLRIASFMRYTRSSLLDVLHNEYLTVARSKGLSERRVIMKHALRNAMIPIATVIGLNVPVLFAGAVIIESVFQWPGIGLLYITAVNQRDDPMIMGLAVMSAVVVFLSNLLTDIMYAFVDPRIRYQ